MALKNGVVVEDEEVEQQPPAEELPPDNSAESHDDGLRADLEAAFDKAEEATDEPPAEGEEPESEEAQQRARDEQGRFAKEKADEAAQLEADASHGGAKVEGEEPPAGQAGAGASDDKAPQSWRPAARELWAKIPAEARPEILRREREHAQFVEESAPVRRFVQDFSQVVSPYLAMIQSEGAQPLQAVDMLLRTAYQLRQGSPQTKTEMVAAMITDYGVDVEQLDAALQRRIAGRGAGGGGAQPAGGVQQPAQFRDPRVDQLFNELKTSAEQRKEQEHKANVAKVEAWGKDKPFFSDLRNDMGMVMEHAHSRGVDMDLDTAYKRAIALNPEIQKIIAQREKVAQLKKNPQGSTSRARAASSSVRSNPTGMKPRPKQEQPGDDGMRSDLEAAYDEVAG